MIGARLGSWVLEAEVGRGGMGTVYRARRMDGDGSAQAAIKVLAAELAVELGFQQRFQREIDILRQLNHPNIVRFYESGVEGDRFWYAMELIQGDCLEDARDERGRIPWRQVIDIAWQVAPALKHAHDRGVIHRDLKPSNLLRDAEGVVKLSDFGIASLFASPHLTVTGGVIGTPEFLSPEQACGKPVTKRSDLYSLGCVLYTLVTGVTPFVGDTVDLLHKHQYGQYERPSRLVPDLHPDFEELIASLLEKDPARRPGDANVLFKRLDSLKKKLSRQTQHAVGATRFDYGPGEREGPATLMSRLMRKELERQNDPGPLGRVFNHPVVLVTLFALCVGTLAFALWPSSDKSLYERGAGLMASDNPEDWETAWYRYFGPLEEKYPGHPYQEQLAEFKRRLDDYRAVEKAKNWARWNRRQSESEWFFEAAMRQRRQGNEKEARRTLEAIVEAFRDVPSEKPWVVKAEGELARQPPQADANAWQAVREATQRAKALEAEGQKPEAEAIRTALRALYRNNPEALAIVNE